MTFEKNTGLCGIDLGKTCTIDAIDEEAEQEVKMLPKCYQHKSNDLG